MENVKDLEDVKFESQEAKELFIDARSDICSKCKYLEIAAREVVFHKGKFTVGCFVPLVVNEEDGFHAEATICLTQNGLVKNRCNFKEKDE